MIEQLAYLNDPLKLEFTAKIVDLVPSGDGQVDVILEQTYFYPTGGGQAHDTGTLGEARVIDVFKDEAGKVIHRVDRELPIAAIPAKIDYGRRLGHMQHHSAQHLLSRAVEELLGLETLSARISADTPSTIDVPMAELAPADLVRVEEFVNGIIFENRPIKSYFIAEDQIDTIPFRRPPKVKGQIRVIEVVDFDYSACGGTHCPHTGMIGLIKILKTENRNKKLRLHFAAGHQALRYFRDDHQIVTELCRSLSTGPDEILQIVGQQAEQVRLARQEISALKTELLSLEVQSLVEQAEAFDSCRLILATFQDRPPGMLRELGQLLQKEAGVIAVLAGYEAPKLSLVVSCAKGTGLSARELLGRQLAPFGGRGGGDATLAQGGGQATAGQIETLFDRTWEDILDLKNSSS